MSFRCTYYGHILSSKNGSHINSWNDEYHYFENELDQLVVEKLFQNSDEVIIRELKLYIEYWGKLNIKNKSQLSSTMFLARYGSLDQYDEYLEKIFIIDHEQLKLDKHTGWTFIEMRGKSNGTFSDHDYFCIRDDLFDRTQATHQDRNIMWKIIRSETNENEYWS